MKKLEQLKIINLDLLKNEFAIARTSFEIAKKYKELAQNLDDSNVDQKAILPFYIFTSFAHLNHCLMSIRKIFFDKQSKSVQSIARYFDNGSLGEEWMEYKETFLNLKRKYPIIESDINEIIAHIGKNRNQNSIFQITENRFKEIENLLDEIVELINNFPNNKAGIFLHEHSALINVMFGFDNLITVTNNGIKNRHQKNAN